MLIDFFFLFFFPFSSSQILAVAMDIAIWELVCVMLLTQALTAAKVDFFFVFIAIFVSLSLSLHNLQTFAPTTAGTTEIVSITYVIAAMSIRVSIALFASL
jgi:hypothetical protein